MQCNSCGTELPQGSIYCPRCGTATVYVVPEPAIALSGTKGPTIASSSNAEEQSFPSTGYGSAPSAGIQQGQYELGDPYSTPLQVSPPPPPDLVPLPQHEGPPGRPSFTRRKGMIALLVGLAFLIMMGSVSFLLYSNWETTNRERATATATAQANATAYAQATATFIASHYPFSNNLVLDDPLSDNSKGNSWDVNTSSDGKETCQFIAGTYHVAALDLQYANHCYARNTTFSNFTYQVQMVIIKGDLGGILFRLGQANNQDIGYRAYISTQGDYALESFVGQNFQVVGSGTSTAIKTGLNQSNLIAIVARGTMLELYVNEQAVMRVVNTTSSQGQIGVLASTYTNQGHPTEVIFSNAKVWKL